MKLPDASVGVSSGVLSIVNDASVGVSSGVLSIVNDASVGELNPNKIKSKESPSLFDVCSWQKAKFLQRITRITLISLKIGVIRVI